MHPRTVPCLAGSFCRFGRDAGRTSALDGEQIQDLCKSSTFKGSRSPGSSMSRSEALRFLNLAHFFDHFFLLIFPTAALAIAPSWDMGYADVLVLGTPMYVMFALGTLPAGWLGDTMDRMTLIATFFPGLRRIQPLDRDVGRPTGNGRRTCLARALRGNLPPCRSGPYHPHRVAHGSGAGRQRGLREHGVGRCRRGDGAACRIPGMEVGLCPARSAFGSDRPAVAEAQQERRQTQQCLPFTRIPAPC